MGEEQLLFRSKCHYYSNHDIQLSSCFYHNESITLWNYQDVSCSLLWLMCWNIMLPSVRLWLLMLSTCTQGLLYSVCLCVCVCVCVCVCQSTCWLKGLYNKVNKPEGLMLISQGFQLTNFSTKLSLKMQLQRSFSFLNAKWAFCNPCTVHSMWWSPYVNPWRRLSIPSPILPQ